MPLYRRNIDHTVHIAIDTWWSQRVAFEPVLGFGISRDSRVPGPASPRNYAYVLVKNPGGGHGTSYGLADV